MTGERFTLYFFPISYYSQKAVQTLFEKGVSFKRCYVDIHNGAQNEVWYLKINPKGLVRVLQDGDEYISESEDIIDYLDKVIPSDKRFTDMIAKNEEMSAKNPELRQELEVKNQRARAFIEIAFNKEKVSAIIDGLEETFDIVEEQLKKSKSRSQGTNKDVWLLGPEFTAPDIIMTTMLNRLEVPGLTERYTSLQKRRLVYDYHQRLLQRPAVKATMKEARSIIWIKIKGNILNKISYVIVLLAIGAAGWGIYQYYFWK